MNKRFLPNKPSPAAAKMLREFEQAVREDCAASTPDTELRTMLARARLERYLAQTGELARRQVAFQARAKANIQPHVEKTA